MAAIARSHLPLKGIPLTARMRIWRVLPRGPWRTAPRRGSDSGGICGRYELHTSADRAGTCLRSQVPTWGPAATTSPRRSKSRLYETESRRRARVVTTPVAPRPGLGKGHFDRQPDDQREGWVDRHQPGIRDAYRTTRCPIPASGFYERARMSDGTKHPVHIGIAEDAPFAFLSLWVRCGRGDGKPKTCAMKKQPQGPR